MCVCHMFIKVLTYLLTYVCNCQQLLDEELSLKQRLFLASFGSNVHPLWMSESPRIASPALYVRIYILHDEEMFVVVVCVVAINMFTVKH